MPDPSMIDLGKKSFNPEELNTPDPVADPAPADPTPPVPPTDDKKGNNPPQDKYTPRETQLYTRAKTAEQQLKEYREKYGDLAGNPPATPNNSTDPFDLAKTVASLKDYDTRELDFAAMVAKGKGIKPEEAVQTEEFKIFLSGKRAIDLKNNSIPRPNSSASSSSVKTADEIAQMSDAEFAAYEKEYKGKQQGGGI